MEVQCKMSAPQVNAFGCHVAGWSVRVSRQLRAGLISRPGSITKSSGENLRAVPDDLFHFDGAFALGYFAFAYYLLFRIDPVMARVTDTLGFDVFFAAISGMLCFLHYGCLLLIVTSIN